MDVSSFLISSVAVLDVLCIIAVIFFERKDASATLAWVFVLLLLPLVGFFAYMFLGSGFKVSKKKRYELKAVYDVFYDNLILRHLALQYDNSFYERHAQDARLLAYLKNEGGGLYTENNAITVYTDGVDKFAALKADLRAATDHIHLLYYIFRNDGIGGEILEILEERARAGVEVRVIYDCMGTVIAFNNMFKGLIAAGGQVRPFSPLFLTLSSHFRMNYRNHRKIALIDGRIGYVGGMNIGDEYMGKDEKLRPWRDTHLRMTGSAVWFLQERFFMDWGYVNKLEIHTHVNAGRYFPKPEETGSLGVQIVSSGPDTKEMPIKCGLLEMLYGARERFFLQTPYFAPDPSFLEALKIAARAGIDVRVMLPAVGDHALVQYANYYYARQIFKAGVSVFLYRGFLHSKALVADGRVTSIGSTNIGNRSFILNFEANAFIYDKGFAARYEEIFLADQENCLELSEEWFMRRSPVQRGLSNAARIFAPLM